MQERPEHTRPHMHPVGLRRQGFLHIAAVLCNKIEASAHGMGSGGLAVDAMAIGCLVVDRRGELFFVLSHFCLCECEVLSLMLETLMATTITVVQYYGPNEELGGAHYLAAFAGDAVGLAHTALACCLAGPESVILLYFCSSCTQQSFCTFKYFVLPKALKPYKELQKMPETLEFWLQPSKLPKQT
jgi:hypothetical protein